MCAPINDTTPCNIEQVATEHAAHDLVLGAMMGKSGPISQSARQVLGGFFSSSDQKSLDFDVDSAASLELSQSPYIQGLSNDLLAKFAAQNSGNIPDGGSFTEPRGG